MAKKSPLLTVVLSLTLGAGCASVSHKASTYMRTATTIVEVNSNVPSEVWVAGQEMGITPLSFPFSYEEEVGRNVRTATYWETNPGIAAGVTVLSLGVYLPFSAIPVEATSAFQPTGTYAKNTLAIRLIAEGHEPLDHLVEVRGEPKIELNLILEKKEGR